MGDWTLFSNHGHVLLYLAGHAEARLRDVAQQVGITERAVQKIVRELQDDGYLTVTKHGRCNRYRLHARRALRHPIESNCTVAKLVQLIVRSPSGSSGDAEAAEPAPAAPPKAEPRTAAVPEPQPAARSEPKPEPRSRPKKDKDEPSGPVDTRQQGSLF